MVWMKDPTSLCKPTKTIIAWEFRYLFFFKVKAQNFFQNGQNYHFDVVGVNACGTERIANETHVTISNALRGAVGKQTGLIYEKIILMM